MVVDYASPNILSFLYEYTFVREHSLLPLAPAFFIGMRIASLVSLIGLYHFLCPLHSLIKTTLPENILIQCRDLYSEVIEVVAARAATAGSEHGAVGGAVGPGSVRHTTKKKVPSTGYSSHHRPRSGNSIRDHPVSAIEHRPLYQFLAAARNLTV